MARVAADSMNGFMYQRYYSIYTFLCYQNECEFFLEEGNEDIDRIKNDKTKIITQVKYHRNKTQRESITNNSGIMKVILAEDNIKDVDTITKIEYISYSPSNEHYTEGVKKAFDDKKYCNIGKYVLLVATKQKNKNRIKNKDAYCDEECGESEENDEEVEEHDFNVKHKARDTINKIDVKLITDDAKLNQIYNEWLSKAIEHSQYAYFSDEDFCEKYFSKFDLKDGVNRNVLANDIDEKIADIYQEFINDSDCNFKHIKICLIFNTIFSMFDYKSFNNAGKNPKEKKARSIKSSVINEEIQKLIKNFTNEKSLENELINSYKGLFRDENISNECKTVYLRTLSNIIDDKNQLVEHYCNWINDKSMIHIDRSELRAQTVMIVWSKLFDRLQEGKYKTFNDIKTITGTLSACCSWDTTTRAHAYAFSKDKLLDIMKGNKIKIKDKPVKRSIKDKTHTKVV